MRMLVGLTLIGSSVFVGAQGPAPGAPTPMFDVASIRQNTSGDQEATVRVEPGGRMTIRNNTLFNIIRNAYTVQGFQIVGGPPWINTDRWDITAKAETEVPQPQLRLMLQNLIADRFKATVRPERRELPVYALVVARPDGRLGPQLNPAAVDCAALAAAVGRTGAPLPPAQPSGRPSCGTRISGGMLMAGATLMTDFARNLSGSTGRIIVNKTGLPGRYDLELKWTPEQLPAPAADSLDTASLFAAIQEQLGLRLEATRAPVDVLVIDSAERPTED